MSMSARTSLLLVSLFSFLAANAWAGEDGLASQDRKAIQSVIEGQLAAFLNDDAKTAYGFAAPAIRKMFATSDIFMAMVRRGYPQVYRSQRAQFSALKSIQGQPTQLVLIEGQDGSQVWAYYVMQRMDDGSWRISGCYLVKADGQST